MDGWPDDWFRDDGPGASAGNRGPGGAERGPVGDPTVQLPHAGAPSQAAAARARAAGGDAWRGQGAPPDTQWPDQSPTRRSRGRAARSGGSGHRTFKIITALVALLLAGTAGMYFYLDSKLNRVAVFADYTDRPTGSAGENWLITGSDSRQGLTTQQENQLATGHDISGQRSDTIMLLHIGGGTPTLVSLPRDLYVDIPGHGMNKINAAFSFGGPKLLAETVQNYTGLRIEHYMGIGFGGLVSVVDSVGGVKICVKQALDDTASGLHLKPGCQTLNGGQALGYVRDRHSFGASDLQRVQDQRAFLKALLSKATSPAVFLNPFTAIPTATSSAGALSVDEGTHLYQLIHVAFALRGPQTTTVPLAGSEATADGAVLLTDRTKALRLFDALGNNQPVPKDLLSGTSGA